MIELNADCDLKQEVFKKKNFFFHYSGNYQRLEFLGDAILQFLASKFVYNQFPSHNEGHLSVS